MARALAAVLCALPLSAAAHEILHTVERGRAIAVRATSADGEALAYREYDVFAPSDAKVPHQKGRTDRNGWLAFVPDSPGTWRVKIHDGGGHGLELGVEATATEATERSGGPSSLAFVLRPVLGVLVVGAIFAALFTLQRRRASRR